MTSPVSKIRCLMLAAVLVPFTNTQQLELALLTGTPTPTQNSSLPVQKEDETEREGKGGKENTRLSTARTNPNSETLRISVHFPPIASAPPRSSIPSAPAPHDPFRNGLGSPYRC